MNSDLAPPPPPPPPYPKVGWGCPPTYPKYAFVGTAVKLSPDLDGILPLTLGSPAFWFALLLIPLTANLRDFTRKYLKRTEFTKSYHTIQEVQKYNIPDYRPRMEWFRNAVHKLRLIQRLKRTSGFAFSQGDGGQTGIICAYDYVG
ncbi:hypothetical protein BDK51DRAFT_34207 [Blyttiomyces helicus]|uniref:Uncharacterized protein n=1 Tax=Blyttiomyces helicus TaxID=388810 RepID=A0A4V1IQV0_9FUNG|nr:hypothetical protein BDK51DRAFT_34207 [Blyttiomyces helicus]|eukprot:RKO87827.1 hypothetical protein BDK51DRAFT_34207 [Blyttiomyces helicus]